MSERDMLINWVGNLGIVVGLAIVIWWFLRVAGVL
jgi:hypothetical protein